MSKAEIVREDLKPRDVETCQRCENHYIMIWMKQGEDYNDFGLRHCPFCGLLTDELTGSVVV